MRSALLEFTGVSKLRSSCAINTALLLGSSVTTLLPHSGSLGIHMMGKPVNSAFHSVSHGMKSGSSMLFKKVSKSLTFGAHGMQTNAIIS